MSHVNKVNRFFREENVYPNLAGLAFSPLAAPRFFGPPFIGVAQAAAFPNPLYFAALILVLPIFIPTIAIACCLTVVAAVIHGVSLIGAGIADSTDLCYENNMVCQ